MSTGVKNVVGDDLALIELAATGRTEAPADVLQRLESRGYLTLRGGPALTASGRARGERLRGMENDLRLMFGAVAPGGSGCRLTAPGSSSIHLTGGPAKIHA